MCVAAAGAAASAHAEAVAQRCVFAHQPRAANGALLCRRCGHMFAGDKGLATHQQVKHGRSYESAKAAVAESRVALVATRAAPLTFPAEPCPAYIPSMSANLQRRRRGPARACDVNPQPVRRVA